MLSLYYENRVMNNEKTPQKAQQKPKMQEKEGTERKIIRIADTDLDGDDMVWRAIDRIPGVGYSYAITITKVLSIPMDRKLQDLDDTLTEKLKEALSNPRNYGVPDWMFNWRRDAVTGSTKHYIGNELRSKTALNIQSLKNSRSYRGYRHSFGYKMRGQRVKSRGAGFRGRTGGIVGVTKKTVAAMQKTQTEEKK
jgi:small subunit ribosomal protein S13